ncbi:DMT family transporter [Citricoccus sp.]|uniref:DMT family transporter n=1 Tax=Citricoccus sp. TaxID=1978372 RepID=UPI0028BF5526|nr:DMT family transporter [Citricoccus sp.]
MKWLSILAALLAACCLALGSERQSVGVRRHEAYLRIHPRTGFLTLFRSPVWLAGGALMILGIILNVYALATAPLTVVQPIGAIAVVITTVLNARIQRLKLNRATIWAIAACVAGSAGFVLIAMVATEENPAPTLMQEQLTAVVALTATAVFALVAVISRRRPSAFLFILGAGVLFGFVAVFVRLASIHLLRGDAGGLLGIPWYQLGIMAVAGLLGVYFVQMAHRHGPPDLVVAGLTVVDPMVGVLTGIIVLGELQPNLPWWVGLCMVVAAAIATLGVVALSRHHPDVIKRREQRRRAARAPVED